MHSKHSCAEFYTFTCTHKSAMLWLNSLPPHSANRQASKIQGTALSAYGHGPVGVVQNRHALDGGTVSTWGRWQIPETKGRKGIRNADQALTVRGERADQIVSSPRWSSGINYNRSMPEDLKLSQIGSSLLLTPFRGLHSPRVRKYCQIIFACYFWKSSDAGFPQPCAPSIGKFDTNQISPTGNIQRIRIWCEVRWPECQTDLAVHNRAQHCSHMWVRHQQKAKRCYKQLVTKAGCCSALKHNSVHSLTLQQSAPQLTHPHAHTHTHTHTHTHACTHTTNKKPNKTSSKTQWNVTNHKNYSKSH